MYCPNCAAQNGDDAKFCRVCGSDLSLVIQAMTGKLRSKQTDKMARRRDREAQGPQKVQKSIVAGFMGLGFVAVALSLLLNGQFWGVYMFIPGFMFIGQGVSALAAAKMSQPESGGPARVSDSSGQSPQRGSNTGDLTPPASSLGSRDSYGGALPVPPPSVTEGTTKIIDPTVQHARDTN